MIRIEEVNSGVVIWYEKEEDGYNNDVIVKDIL